MKFVITLLEAKAGQGAFSLLKCTDRNVFNARQSTLASIHELELQLARATAHNPSTRY